MPYLKFVLTKFSIFSLLILFFSSSLQLLDEKKLQETKNLYADFESPEKAAKVYDSILRLILIDCFFFYSLKSAHLCPIAFRLHG